MAERLVIAGILQHGAVVFHDVASLVQDQSFFLPQNHILFSTLKHLIVDQGIIKPDTTAILGQIQTMDKTLVAKYDMSGHILALTQNKITPESIKPFVNRVATLGLARNFRSRMEAGLANLDKISGDESVSEVIAIVEKPINDFTVNILHDDDITSLGEDMGPYLEYLAEAKPKIQGIPTGMPIFDQKLGGGLRRPGVHLVGARSGVGKSQLAVNVAEHNTKLDIPVLLLDTELTKEITLSRWAARNSGMPIDQIETGSFADNMKTSEKVAEVMKDLKNRPFYYYNISSKHHTDWISVMRRFIMKIVGFENGKVKPCLIILDYLKMMNLSDSGSFQEFQYLGQIITDLHNFAIQYEIAILATIQLNRDGITKDDQSTASGSDRLVWLCSSFSILKDKTAEDYAADGPQNGNKKLIIAKSRFGPGTLEGQYINLQCDLSRSIMVEGQLNTQNRQGQISYVAPTKESNKESTSKKSSKVVDKAEDDYVPI